MYYDTMLEAYSEAAFWSALTGGVLTEINTLEGRNGFAVNVSGRVLKFWGPN